MGLYVNPGNEEFYNASLRSKIYVDKTEMIKFTNSQLFGEHKNICVSRPRSFGKSIAANMLVAYYSRGCDSKELFEKFKISSLIWKAIPKLLAKFSETDLFNPARIDAETKEASKREAVFALDFSIYS